MYLCVHVCAYAYVYAYVHVHVYVLCASFVLFGSMHVAGCGLFVADERAKGMNLRMVVP